MADPYKSLYLPKHTRKNEMKREEKIKIKIEMISHRCEKQTTLASMTKRVARWRCVTQLTVANLARLCTWLPGRHIQTSVYHFVT